MQINAAALNRKISRFYRLKRTKNVICSFPCFFNIRTSVWLWIDTFHICIVCPSSSNTLYVCPFFHYHSTPLISILYLLAYLFYSFSFLTFVFCRYCLLFSILLIPHRPSQLAVKCYSLTKKSENKKEMLDLFQCDNSPTMLQPKGIL